MEIAATLAATLATTGTAAAGTAGTAAATAGTASTVFNILQGTASVFGALSAIGAGAAAADEANAQAFQAQDQAVAEEAQGLARRTEMKRSLARIIGENDVNFAAAGIDISSGIAAGNREFQNREAVSQMTIDRADTDRQRAALRARASGYRGVARSRRAAGFLEAGGRLASFGADMAQRG
jgi:hypothetical protein